MSDPKTLLQLAGADLQPPQLGDACLVIVDMQNEYLDGPLALPAARAAITQAQTLVSKAREAGCPVFHVAHKGGQEACLTVMQSAVRSWINWHRLVTRP